MPLVTRIGDATSPPGVHVSGSSNTYCSNIPVTRLGDADVSVCGGGVNISASNNVYVNNILIHRLGDAIVFALCGGSSIMGSSDFIAN